ncbi:hypothetical protein B9Z65_7374 [Elsinoe australis]|uniref:Uncharacterized protein n=1 Tax=Elsinoe australis TaxID=40998 RepID=A0A2P7YC28_9PEZI|nr:hypothetical protein B9Z65_7374 [Elsinoe australis]
MPSLIQSALLLEFLGNLTGGLGFLLAPRLSLSFFVRDSTLITPLSLSLLQMLGGITIALAVPLVVAYPDTPSGVTHRRSAYLTLGAGEAMIVPLMLAWRGSEGCPFSDGFVFGGAGVLAGICAFRAYVLGFKPELMQAKGARKGL